MIVFIYLDLNVIKYIPQLCQILKILIKLEDNWNCFVSSKSYIFPTKRSGGVIYSLSWTSKNDYQYSLSYYLLSTYHMPDTIPYLRSSQLDQRDEIYSYITLLHGKKWWFHLWIIGKLFWSLREGKASQGYHLIHWGRQEEGCG